MAYWRQSSHQTLYYEDVHQLQARQPQWPQQTPLLDNVSGGVNRGGRYAWSQLEAPQSSGYTHWQEPQDCPTALQCNGSPQGFQDSGSRGGCGKRANTAVSFVRPLAKKRKVPGGGILGRGPGLESNSGQAVKASVLLESAKLTSGAEIVTELPRRSPQADPISLAPIVAAPATASEAEYVTWREKEVQSIAARAKGVVTRTLKQYPTSSVPPLSSESASAIVGALQRILSALTSLKQVVDGGPFIEGKGDGSDAEALASTMLANQQEVEALRSRVQELDTILQTKNQAIVVLKRHQRAQGQTITKLLKQVQGGAEPKAGKEGLPGQVEVLSEMMSKLGAEVAERQRQAAKQFMDKVKTRLERSEREKAAVAQKLEKAEREKAAVAQKLEKAECEKAAVVQKLGTVETERTALGEKLGIAKSEKAAMGKKLENVESDMAGLEKKLAKVECEKAALGKKLAQVECEKATLGSKLEKLLQRLDTEEGQVSDLRRRVCTLEGELEAVQSSYSDEVNELRAEMDSRALEFATERLAFAAEKESLQEMVSEAQGSAKEEVKALTLRLAQVSRKRVAVKALCKRVEKAEERAAEAQRYAEVSQRVAKEAAAELARAKGEVRGNSTGALELLVELRGARHARGAAREAELAQQLQEVRARGLAREAELGEQLQEAQAEVQTLQQRVSKMEEELLCSACMEQPVDTVLEPCLHAYCADCAQRARSNGRCCTEPVKSLFRFYRQGFVCDKAVCGAELGK